MTSNEQEIFCLWFNLGMKKIFFIMFLFYLLTSNIMLDNALQHKIWQQNKMEDNLAFCLLSVP